MSLVKQNLENWRSSLATKIPVAGLLSRNAVAYKWKCPFRCWLIREAAFWRVTDVLTQSLALHEMNHGLGARILLRSGFETLAMLIYLNENMAAVLQGNLDFHEFSDLTARQSVGSKLKAWSNLESVNVLTMLNKGDKKYPGLRRLYDGLSESAHPSFEGTVWGYSKVDHNEYETVFSNRWMELYGEGHLRSLQLCMETFHYEYDENWVGLIEKFEAWIVANDEQLEATKQT